MIPPSPLYSPGNKKAASAAALVSGDSTPTLPPPQGLMKPCSALLPRLWPQTDRVLPAFRSQTSCHCSQPSLFPARDWALIKIHDGSLSVCQWSVTCPIRYLSHREEEKPLLPPQAFTVTAACDRVVQKRGASKLTLQAHHWRKAIGGTAMIIYKSLVGFGK